MLQRRYNDCSLIVAQVCHVVNPSSFGEARPSAQAFDYELPVIRCFAGCRAPDP